MPYRCFEELGGPGVPEPPPPDEYDPPEPIFPGEDMGRVERAVRVRATDYLRVSVWTLAVPFVYGSYTVILDDETVVKTPFKIQISEWAVINTQQFPLVDGWLVDASVYCTDQLVQHGQIYASMYLISNANEAVQNARCLAAGYTTYMVPVSFPHGGITHSGTGPGYTVSRQAGDPGYGNEIVIYFGQHYKTRVQSIILGLETSAAPGDRDIRVNIGDVLQVRIPTKQPPSTNRKYVLGAFPDVEHIDTEHYISAPLPYTLERNNTISTTTKNLDEGDHYYWMQVSVTQWVMTNV